MTNNKKPDHKKSQSSIPEKNFQGMIESTAGIPWVLDYSSFQFTYVGPQAEKVLGYPAEQWYENDFWGDHIHPDDREAALSYCLEASLKGQDYDFEYRMIHRDGHDVWILDYANVVIEDGKPVRLQGFMFDTSAHKQADQSLREHTALVDAVYRASPDMIFIHANDGRILDANENTVRRFGYTRKEMRNKTIADISADENLLNMASAYVQEAMAGLKPDFEWRCKDSNGHTFPVEVRLRKLQGGDAVDAPAVIAVVRDISERKRSEDAVKHIAAGIAAETGDSFYQHLLKHLATLFDADHAFIGLLDENNPHIINTLSVLAHGNNTKNRSYALQQTTSAEVLARGTCAYPNNVQQSFPDDQLLIDIGVDSYIGTPLFDSNNQAIGLIVVLDSKPMKQQQQFTEILEIFASRVAAEVERSRVYQQLERTQQKLSLHVQKTPLGVIEWDTDFCVTDWNPAAEKIFGFTKKRAMGCNARKLIIPAQHHEHVEKMWQTLFNTGGGTRSTDDNITQQGTIITCEWYNTPLINDDGIVVGVASLVLDITDRIQAETELKNHHHHLEQQVELRTADLQNINQELESFSYSVSHDLRAPLRHINGFSQILLEDYFEQLDEDGQKLIERIRSNTAHMEHLIDNLLQLSRVSRSKIVRESLNLSDIAHQIIDKLQQHDNKRNVGVTIQSELHVSADHQLTRVLLENLIDNAWKYTAKTQTAKICLGISSSENAEQIFCLRDNGAGFDMQYADKLFTAFKRLHSDSEFEGIGIGLATVKRIINRHGGKVWAEAEAGKGAAFYFSLGKP